MSITTNVLLVIVNQNGEVLLSETHDVFFGPIGLLQVPTKLSLQPEDLVCFPSLQKALDQSNMGAPFIAVCDVIKKYQGSCIATALSGAGYLCCCEGVLEVCARIQSLNVKPPRAVGSGLHESTSKTSRKHLSAVVRSAMKALCNKLCPRDEQGIMLSERGRGCMKRPAWVIDKVMSELRADFDSEELDNAKAKAVRYMTRSAMNFKRLLTISGNTQSLSKSAASDDSSLISQYTKEAAIWRQGPYGVLWTEEHLKREPTSQEISACAERIAQRKIVHTTKR